MAARAIKHKKAKRRIPRREQPFAKENYYLFGLAAVVIAAGYVSLAQGPVNSFWSLTLAPILLVTGYCGLIPLAIMFTKKRKLQDKS